ncbi:hypothetical protein [Solwaraspora sp. WMMD792]|uniref:hypothetical protein n=2 Tax=Micromonosporaceae TaxID=28056 RepID=UPI002417909C|nr:hypothetical protein [Solwaraspora sp. WMMD792]MDG4768735.1 hypothetical protein [Solwaraspora sp. WMMD792]MDG4768774.1 hypothetical protein [Solwaraspora sp. WMMD792]MDG4768816.1 hypothetical protein [Solwaraspora sp. WMMD792]MDG4768871.1 hypothetical protein [Solwaraspora sp. WMMD792]MDG4768901.1 hypothetical protein [Solwaraspora sp. WMMD792]
MRNRMLVAAIVAAAVTALGCGAGSDEDAATPAPTSAPADDSLASAAAAAGIPPTPSPEDWAAYISALKDINPDIVGDKDEKTIIDRGRSQCQSIGNGEADEAKLVQLTNLRFSAPGYPDGFGEETATQILAVVRQYICPDF